VYKIIISHVILLDHETSFLSETNNILTKNSIETILTANAPVTFKSSEIDFELKFIENNRLCISNFIYVYRSFCCAFMNIKLNMWRYLLRWNPRTDCRICV